MATEVITDGSASRLKAGETIWDETLKGFGIRRQRTACVYIFKCRIGGKQKLITIGKHGSPWTANAARDAAKHYATTSRGGLGASISDTNTQDPCLADLAQRYVTSFAQVHKKRRSILEDRRNLDLHILPLLGPLRLSEISRSHICRFHMSQADHPVNANRCLALISHLFSMAEKWGLRQKGTNPCRGVDRFPELKRGRLLSPEEMKRLGDALNAAEQRNAAIIGNAPIDWRATACIRLLIYTGARLTEILSLQWKYIDWERGLALLPMGKGQIKRLPLPAPAMSVLSRLREQKEQLSDVSCYVLPGPTKDKYFTAIQKPWRRIRTSAGLDGVRIEDLRHSFEATARLVADPEMEVAHRTASYLASALGPSGSATSKARS